MFTFQLIPSELYVNGLVDPVPPATQFTPFHANALHSRMVDAILLLGSAVQLIPSVLYAKGLTVPVPPVTHKEPFHATVLHCVSADLELGLASQFVPS